MSQRLVADICVVLKTLPTREAVPSLANKVFEELKKTAPELATAQMNITETGFEIVSPASPSVSTVEVTVQVLVTTQYQNLRKLDPTQIFMFINGTLKIF